MSTATALDARAQVRRDVLPLVRAMPENFSAYGQVIMPGEDGQPFGPGDAQLDLSLGVPRFYAMRLTNRGRVFTHITRHRRVTQCLGAMMGTPWMIALAAPSGESDVPDLATLRAFFVPGDRFVKLHRGTWHAGPYFSATVADFYNLELADTNIVDHQSCHLGERFGVEFAFGAEPLE